MRKTPILLLVLLQLFAGNLRGQERYGFEIGPYGGWDIWNDRHFQVGAPQAAPPINLNLSYKDRVVYGGRFNLLSRDYWGGELSYGYQSNTVRLTRQSFTPVDLKGGIHQFFYNTIFYPARYGPALTPFLTAGIGLASYHLSDEARAKAADPRGYGIGSLASWDRRFAFNYGGGVKANISSHVGLRVDFRHNFSDVPSYGLPKESSNPAQVVLPIQGKLQNYEASAGIYFRWME